MFVNRFALQIMPVWDKIQLTSKVKVVTIVLSTLISGQVYRQLDQCVSMVIGYVDIDSRGRYSHTWAW